MGRESIGEADTISLPGVLLAAADSKSITVARAPAGGEPATDASHFTLIVSAVQEGAL